MISNILYFLLFNSDSSINYFKGQQIIVLFLYFNSHKSFNGEFY